MRTAALLISGIIPPAVALLSLLATGCSGVETRSALYIIETLSVAAPEAPALCADAARHPTTQSPRATLYVFTSDWCAACDRLLTRLDAQRADFAKARIAVIHLVTGQGTTCIDAARVGRRASVPYGAASRQVEANWGVRSTPTMWLVDCENIARLYVEGEPEEDALFGAMGESLGGWVLKSRGSAAPDGPFCIPCPLMIPHIS
ncbi:hypothetical protein FRC96_08565 [Lujinxingia vulgaris]|uniref:Thioredoxin domain-containing protein n=1 Tax=Lujinxingia vulgaris TaxID=2600176 RepID=A0A5C6X4J7_9DELT|nr:hypothetical protein [Lujinxingia vulgaris]TXD36768.1 hypothetical protein FRC96_08565 [Lujinxingia vulgaris]